VVAVYDGWTPADLRTLALRLVAMSPCVALLGSRGEKAQIVFAQSDGLPHDIPALLREAAEFLGGRGGGKGNLAQGGGDRLDALPAALERAASRVRGASKGP
jgi:alanyl-tRNA synthetase